MNYFEIFNRVLLELNSRPVQAFNLIYKSEHKKILSAVNIVNNEVLSSFEWPFMLHRGILDVPAGEKSCKLPLNGKVKSVYEIQKGNKAQGRRFSYVSTPENILAEEVCGDYYSIFNNCIIFPKSSKDRTFDIFYYLEDFAAGADGNFKPQLALEDDISLIPMPYAEQILVYGTCLKVKAMPAYPKFGFWNTMYIQALRNLRQKSSHSIECEPCIKLV